MNHHIRGRAHPSAQSPTNVTALCNRLSCPRQGGAASRRAASLTPQSPNQRICVGEAIAMSSPRRCGILPRRVTYAPIAPPTNLRWGTDCNAPAQEERPLAAPRPFRPNRPPTNLRWGNDCHALATAGRRLAAPPPLRPSRPTTEAALAYRLQCSRQGGAASCRAASLTPQSPTNESALGKRLSLARRGGTPHLLGNRQTNESALGKRLSVARRGETPHLLGNRRQSQSAKRSAKSTNTTTR